MARKFRIAGIVVVGLLLVGGGAVLYVYRATQRVPAFYELALASDPIKAAQASDECLQQMTALASDLRQPGEWQASFTAEQINGWLAVDLVRNYPDLLPSEIQAPRIAIADNQATVACRVVRGDVSTVFSLTLDVYLSEPNMLALRLRSARAGALPMPLAKVLDAITEGARKTDVPIEWRQNHGDPVALISLAAHDSLSAGQIDAVELRDGALWIAGHTTEKPSKSHREIAPKAEAEPSADEVLPADDLPVAIAPPVSAGAISAGDDSSSDENSADAESASEPTDDRDTTGGKLVPVVKPPSKKIEVDAAQAERDELEDEASLQTLEAEMKRIDQR